MELDEVREQKALRDENARLKRLVADEALNIQVPKEVTSKNDEPVAAPSRGRKRGCGGSWLVPADVPYRACAFQPCLPAQAADAGTRANGGGDRGAVAQAPALRHRWLHALVLRRGLG